MPIIAKNLGKSIGQPATRILSNISLKIEDGEFIALTGRSGSGKSTLLYLLSTLDTLSEGSIWIENKDLSTFTQTELYTLRNEKIGFVFQFHYLIAELNALDNVLLPAKKTHQEEKRRAYAIALLERFDLGDKMHRLPRQLSGGEQQRVAIARSLIMEPRYVFADEPTGSLDSANGELVMNILQNINQKQGTSFILVTHDPDFAQLAHRQIRLTDGKLLNAI